MRTLLSFAYLMSRQEPYRCFFPKNFLETTSSWAIWIAATGKRIFLFGFLFEIAPPPSAFPQAAGTKVVFRMISTFTGYACTVSNDHVRKGLAIFMIRHPLIFSTGIQGSWTVRPRTSWTIFSPEGDMEYKDLDSPSRIRMRGRSSSNLEAFIYTPDQLSMSWLSSNLISLRSSSRRSLPGFEARCNGHRLSKLKLAQIFTGFHVCKSPFHETYPHYSRVWTAECLKSRNSWM